ncbi:MAG: hypothetical protein ACRCX2_05930 [Paraclostridium sp.]
MNRGNNALSERIVQYIQSKVPMTFPNKMIMDIADITVAIPDSIYDIENQLAMRYAKKGSTEGHVGALVTISDQHGNVINKKKFASLFKFPVKTDRGVFIVNGIEKNILSQMRRKPGCYTSNNGNNSTKTTFMFSRKDAEGYMPQISFTYNPADSSFTVDIKTLKMNILNFLSVLGFTDMEIQAALGNDMFAEAVINKHSRQRNAKSVSDLFKVFYPRGVEEGHVSEDRMRVLILEFFSKNAMFEKKSKVIESNLGVKNTSYLNKEVIFKAVKKTMSVSSGLVEADVADDLKYKDVYSDTDLIMEAFVNDFDKFVDEAFSAMTDDTRSPKGGDKSSWVMNSIGKASSSKSIAALFAGDLTRASEEINPLYMESLQSTVTMLGQGGLSKNATRNEENARNLTISGMNRIDPVHTPESGNIGLVQHLTVGAKIEDNTIKAPFYKVVNGTATINEKKKIFLESVDEEKHIIAYHDTKYVSKSGDKLIFKTDLVPARYMGKTEMYPVNKVEFIDASSNALLGTAGNLIPFVSHNDGSRVLMGASMQGQAITLVNREKPMVSTLANPDSGQTFDDVVGEKHGKPVRSDSNGVVQKITDFTIEVVDKKGKIHTYNYYKHYPLNQSFMNNELKVKVGETVTAGQILAEGWQTKDGSLALGVNARIGFLPYKGYNYEDGVVISKSFADKMITEDTHEIEFDIKTDFIGGKGSAIKKELTAYTVSSALGKLDDDGIIKMGEYVKAGSVVVAGLKEISVATGGVSGFDRLRMNANDSTMTKYSEMQIPQGSYLEGKVVRIATVPNPDSAHKQKIIITLVSNKPLKVGDKISGRHGNKGTITKILDDSIMPTTTNGKPLELLFSPLAVPSRKNVGQIFEVNAGLIAEKTGKQYLVDNFNHEEKDKLLAELKKIGCPDGKDKVLLKEEDDEGNIIDVPVENPVTVGNMYIMKLKHKVDEKIQSRNNLGTYVSEKDHMPGKVVGSSAGEKGNPQSMGEMELRALQGHGAVWNLLESTTIKSDGGGTRDNRKAMYKAIATGELDSADLKDSASPETLKVMSDYLKTIGFNVKPMHYGKEVGLDKPFDSIGIAPLNGDEFIKSIGEDKEVHKQGAIRARQFFNEDEKGKPGSRKRPEADGGLLDPTIFGDKDIDSEKEIRNKWGYIKLATPVPNPALFESASNNPYTVLTGIKRSDLSKVNDGFDAIIADPQIHISSLGLPEDVKTQYLEHYNNGLEASGFKVGEIVPVASVDKLIEKGIAVPAKSGGDAINYLLSQIDVESDLEQAKSDLDLAVKAEDISIYHKKVRCLEMLKNNNLKPTDLMVKYVPVAPTYLRPISFGNGDKRPIVDDMNKIYDKILLASSNAKKDNTLDENGFVDAIKSDVKSYGANSASIYKALSRLDGSVKTTDRTGDDLVTVLGKTSVPGALGGKDGLFRSKMLSKRMDFSGRSVIGVDPNLRLNEAAIPLDMAKQLYKPFIIKEIMSRGIEATESAASSRLNNADDEIKSLIQDIANDRPVLLNRQPTLHKLGVQAFKPIIKDYEDGMAVRSIQLNPLVVTGLNADFDGDTMAVHLPVTEKAKEEAKELMMPTQNLINPGDGSFVVEIRHEMALGLFQLTKTWRQPVGVPVMYSNFNDLRKDYLTGKVSSNQAVNIPTCPHPTTAGGALFNWCIPDKLAHYRDYKKTWDKKSISKLIMDIYKEAEKSDFKAISRMDIANVLDRLKKVGFDASTRSGVSIGSSDFTKLKELSTEIEKANKKGASLEEWQKLEGELKEKINDGILGEDNPLHIMMKSGARASSGQVLKMVGMIGTGMDISKKSIDPIASSHFDGLSPQEYFRLGQDSRKGMYDRAVSTAAPGALTRTVWGATQDVVVTEADCKTKEHIMLKKTDKTINGRFAGKDILDKEGKVICKRDQMITNDVYASLYADDTIEYIPVRSALRCKVPKGVCQKCYGAMAGTNQVVKIGVAVGVIASQSMGEPLTQMTMNTFHTGGANSAATLGLPRIKNIVNLTKDIKVNKAVICENEGVVTSIEDTPTATLVTVGKKKYQIKKTIDSKGPKLKVKVGDAVHPGDFITVGDVEDISAYMDDKKTQIVFTNASPKQLFEQKSKHIGQSEAMNYTRDYLAGSMQYALNQASATMDRRNSEIIVSKLTSICVITDSGDSPFMKGQEMDTKTVNKWNEVNCKAKTIATVNKQEYIGKICATNVKNTSGQVVVKAGQIIDQVTANLIQKSGTPSIKVSLRPAEFKMTLDSTGAGSVWSKGHDNWLSNAGVESVRNQVTRGATFGQVDKLEDPRSRTMTGTMLRIGDGIDMPEPIANGMKDSMRNFFSPTLDNSIEKAKKVQK